MVGAFVEALVLHLDEELCKFYFDLLKSEARHFQGYLKLAYHYGDAQDVPLVIERVRAAEQELIESLTSSSAFTVACQPEATATPINVAAGTLLGYFMKVLFVIFLIVSSMVMHAY